MLEEGLTESFSSQGELELKATLERARQAKVPSPEARPQMRGIMSPFESNALTAGCS